MKKENTTKKETQNKRAKKNLQKESYIPDYEQLFTDAADSVSDSKKPFTIYKTLIRQYRWKILVSTLLYILRHLPVWIIPLITAEVINLVTQNAPNLTERLTLWAAVMLFVLLQNIPFHVLREKYNNEMLRTIGAGLRNTVIKKLQHLSITYHKQIETGKLQAKFLRDITAIEQLNIQITNSLLLTVINVLVYAFVSILRSKAVSLFFLFLIPVNVLVVFIFRKNIKKTNYIFRVENEKVSAKVTNMINMIPVTKAHGLEDTEISLLEDNLRHLKSTGLSVDKVTAYFGSTTWVISQIMSGICLFFTVWLAIRGTIPIGDIVLFQTYFTSISGSIQTILNIMPQLTRGLDSISSVSEIILSKDLEQNNDKIRLRHVHGTVQFKNVCYRYPNTEEDAIKDFSLNVEPGECVAFVGTSGSGKTTIMNMIIGFLLATKGSLTIDGKPIEELNLVDYRHFISVVPQNCILFSGTIRENITYGLDNVSEERLQKIVHLANIDEFVDKLPLGLDTQLGENGTLLSGGQKQRISIARALIRDPKILILDEATSALDNISEYHVQQAIERLTHGRTTFIVAHRLSTIRNADKIVVMENGRCIECGTYGELMEKEGKFFELKNLNDVVSS